MTGTRLKAKPINVYLEPDTQAALEELGIKNLSGGINRLIKEHLRIRQYLNSRCGREDDTDLSTVSLLKFVVMREHEKDIGEGGAF